jgi:hypothetical protein
MKFPKNCKNYFFSKDDNLFYWTDTDTEDNFKKKISKQSPDLYRLWEDVSITYLLNSFGFRTKFSLIRPPKKTKKRMLALGCSYTFGTGLHDDQIWCNIVGKRLKYEVINLGMPGGSLDSIFRILYSWCKTVEPDIIIIQVPHPTRREFFTDDLSLITAGSWREGFPRFRQEFWGDEYDKFYNLKNYLLIEKLTESTPVKYVEIENFLQSNDFARDGLHLGPETHKKFAEYIIGNIL